MFHAFYCSYNIDTSVVVVDVYLFIVSKTLLNI